MKQFLFATDDSWTGLLLRLCVGCIMFSHGAQKLLGLFGGYGFKTTVSYFTNTMKLPWVVSFLVIVIEFFGALFLLMGFTTRLYAILFIAIMTAAIITTNYKNGFFMNWFGNQQGEGFEYHLLVIGICTALIITGGGRYSIDGLMKAQWFELLFIIKSEIKY